MVQLNCLDPGAVEVCEWLIEDFKVCPPSGLANPRTLTISIEAKPPPRASYFWFWRPRVTVYGWGQKKSYQIAGGVKMNIEFKQNRSVQIAGPSAELIYQTLYLLILSTLGEWFESEGWTRLHAMSVETPTSPVLLIAPQGFGKSLLSALLLKGNSIIRSLGDEIALVRGQEFLAIPLRLALRPAIAKEFEIPQSGRLTFKNGHPHKAILELSPLPQTLHGPPQVFYVHSISNSWQIRSTASLRSLVDIVLGRGLPQMVEYLIRRENIPNLIGTVIRRAQWANLTRKEGRLQEIAAGERTKVSFEKFCVQMSIQRGPKKSQPLTLNDLP